MTSPAGLNGHNGVSAEDLAARQMAEAAFERYPQLAAQLGAIVTLLASLPLPLMLEANRRHQRASMLTLPASVTPVQAAALAARLRGEEGVIRAAQGVLNAVVAGTQGR